MDVVRGRTLVVGLGNPILGDDGVGWSVADEVERWLPPGGAVAIERASLGGLSLMERLVGYDRAVIVDALHTGAAPVGTVTRLGIDALPDPGAGHTTSVHDVSLATALAIGRTLGAAVPDEIDVVGVETAPQFEFSQTLSPAVAAAVPTAVATVFECLPHGCVSEMSPVLRQEARSHGIP
jgi:hydrogenase maturation protease